MPDPAEIRSIVAKAGEKLTESGGSLQQVENELAANATKYNGILRRAAAHAAAIKQLIAEIESIAEDTSALSAAKSAVDKAAAAEAELKSAFTSSQRPEVVEALGLAEALVAGAINTVGAINGINRAIDDVVKVQLQSAHDLLNDFADPQYAADMIDGPASSTGGEASTLSSLAETVRAQAEAAALLF